MRAASHRSTLVSVVLLAMMLIAAMLAATALAGCAASPKPLPSVSGTADAAPVFASDDEALAAAEKAYAAYQKVGDAVGQDGGDNAERFQSVAVGAALEQASTAARSSTRRRSSSRRIKHVHDTSDAVQRTTDLGSIPRSSCTSAMTSSTGTDSLTKSGRRSRSQARPSKLPFASDGISGSWHAPWFVSDKVLWEGENFCCEWRPAARARPGGFVLIGQAESTQAKGRCGQEFDAFAGTASNYVRGRSSTAASTSVLMPMSAADVRQGRGK